MRGWRGAVVLGGGVVGGLEKAVPFRAVPVPVETPRLQTRNTPGGPEHGTKTAEHGLPSSIGNWGRFFICGHSALRCLELVPRDGPCLAAPNGSRSARRRPLDGLFQGR